MSSTLRSGVSPAATASSVTASPTSPLRGSTIRQNRFLFADDVYVGVAPAAAPTNNAADRSWYRSWLDNTGHFFSALGRGVTNAVRVTLQWAKEALRSLGAKVFSLTYSIRSSAAARQQQNVAAVATPAETTRALRELARMQVEIQHSLEEALAALTLTPQEVDEFTKFFRTIESEATDAADIALREAQAAHADRKASAAKTYALLAAKQATMPKES